MLFEIIVHLFAIIGIVVALAVVMLCRDYDHVCSRATSLRYDGAEWVRRRVMRGSR